MIFSINLSKEFCYRFYTISLFETKSAQAGLELLTLFQPPLSVTITDVHHCISLTLRLGKRILFKNIFDSY